MEEGWKEGWKEALMTNPLTTLVGLCINIIEISIYPRPGDIELQNLYRYAHAALSQMTSDYCVSAECSNAREIIVSCVVALSHGQWPTTTC